MTIVDSPIAALDTPVLLVDADRLERNIQRFASAIAPTEAALRPHVKTHKTIEIAAMQLEAGANGITCAKLAEAEEYVAAGFTDIFVAYPIVGLAKARRAVQLAQRCHLIVGVESDTGIAQLAEAANAAGVVLDVRLELESGLQRTGVAPTHAADLCRLVMKSPGLRLEGLFTFRGASFPGAPAHSPTLLGQQEGEWMVAQAEQLRAAGVPISSISVGSTPTAIAAAQVPGITEVRPGTYVFCDRLTYQEGACAISDIALSILATVVSRPSADVAIIDAGSKTFCGDVCPPHAGLVGYGCTTDGQGGIIERMNEEHGIVRLSDGCAPAIGEKIAFYPNHVCTAVNLADELMIVRDGVVEACWEVVARGKRQ